MQDLAVEEKCHCRQIDMWVRPHVDSAAEIEPRWSHVIDEDEGPHHATCRGGQEAPHTEVLSQLAFASLDFHLDCRIVLLPALRLDNRQQTHAGLLRFRSILAAASGRQPRLRFELGDLFSEILAPVIWQRLELEGTT